LVSVPDTIVLKNVSKMYDFGKIAVNHVWLGIKDKECFGLLGQNGAGKTSIFKMMTGDVIISSGKAYIKGLDVGISVKQVSAFV